MPKYPIFYKNIAERLMINSMTAYASYQKQSNAGILTWELKSLNQRYMEVNFRLPEGFKYLEPELRNTLKQHIHRGKIDCSLVLEQPAEDCTLQINQPLVKQIINHSLWVNKQAGATPVQLNPVDVLTWPGVLMPSGRQDTSKIANDLIISFQYSIDRLTDNRQTEGKALTVLLQHRLKLISQQLVNIKQQLPAIKRWQKEQLELRLAEIDNKPDPSCITQALLILLNKQDITEELDRLNAHMQETKRILATGGIVGRRLDFMMQEFNREINTLAAKTINNSVTQAAIEIKVLIEQMREQIQNIE